MNKAPQGILYLSYDGLTDPLGQSQVIPYLAGLSDLGHPITIISFEKPEAYKKNRAHISGLLGQAGIEWVPMRYHKRPPVLSGIWDARALYRKAAQLAATGRYRIVHCRSYLPAMAGLKLKQKYGMKFLFDMRGFWADERVDGHTWNLSNPVYHWVFRYFKRKEKTLLMQADHIVSLTHAGKRVIMEWFPDAGLQVEVIPCCCDNDLFSERTATPEKRAAARDRLGLSKDTPVLSYLGALGTFYLLDEMLAFFGSFRAEYPDARFLFITLHDPAYIYAHAARHGIPKEALVVTGAPREEVPVLISLSDYSVFFITPLFSKSASSPTKQAEVMSMGIPVICNSKVGDTEMIVSENRCGVVVSDFTTEAFSRAIDELKAARFDPTAIRETAIREFSLDEGIRRYASIYDRLLQG